MWPSPPAAPVRAARASTGGRSVTAPPRPSSVSGEGRVGAEFRGPGARAESSAPASVAPDAGAPSDGIMVSRAQVQGCGGRSRRKHWGRRPLSLHFTSVRLARPEGFEGKRRLGDLSED